jgi:hypothetical protein
MRTLALTLTFLIGCLVGALGLSSAASAAPIVSITWSSTTGTGTTGGSAIDAAPGDTLMAEMFVSTDIFLSLYSVTLHFDADLGDELDLLGYFEDFTMVSGGQIPNNPTESTGAVVGQITSIDDNNAFIPKSSITGTFRIAKITFEVTGNVTSDGDDLDTGLFNVGFDGFVDKSFNVIDPTVTFLGAEVNVVPEPGTVGLLAFGLLGLVVAGRARR